jgi:catechol 2,3-dioxygenase-like lactoylglutathione lyase family enzyme
MKSVRHVGLVVHNLEHALHFYRDLLGLRITRRMDERGSHVDAMLGMGGARVITVKMSAHQGRTMLELLAFEQAADTETRARALDSPGFTHVAFEVTDIDGLYQRLAQAGVPFNSAPQLSPDGVAKVAFCRDPEGNSLELVEILR